jgi:hypothetical protein
LGGTRRCVFSSVSHVQAELANARSLAPRNQPPSSPPRPSPTARSSKRTSPASQARHRPRRWSIAMSCFIWCVQCLCFFSQSLLEAVCGGWGEGGRRCVRQVRVRGRGRRRNVESKPPFGAPLVLHSQRTSTIRDVEARRGESRTSSDSEDGVWRRPRPGAGDRHTLRLETGTGTAACGHSTPRPP